MASRSAKTTSAPARSPLAAEPPRVGDTLAALRQARALSLDELSRLAGVSKSMLSQIERAQANPTVAVVWRLVYRDPPAVVGPALALGAAADRAAGFTWPQLWRTRSLWGLLLSRFISDPVWYFCLFWLPGYLQERSGLTLAQIGLLGWIPFLVADLGGVGSSLFSDRLVRRGVAPLRARQLTLAGAAVFAPVCLLTPHFPHPFATLAIFSVVGAVCLTWLFNLGVVVADAFPAANVGSVWGIAGAFGATGAICFNVYVGHLMETFGAGRIFVALAVLHPLAAVVLWLTVRREHPNGSGLSAA